MKTAIALVVGGVLGIVLGISLLPKSAPGAPASAPTVICQDFQELHPTGEIMYLTNCLYNWPQTEEARATVDADPTLFYATISRQLKIVRAPASQ